MKWPNQRIFLRLFVLLFLFVPLFSQAASEASYVFRHGQPREYIFEQTLSILKEYNFAILSSNSEKGKIETDFKFINRKVMPDFSLKYVILIEGKPYGTRIDVTAKIKDHKGGKSRIPRDEIKSAWWIIKALIKRVGR